MNWLVYHIVSGQSFFTGIALIVLSVVLSSLKKPIAKRVSVMTFIVGLMAVVVSSTAIPYWYYGVVALVTAIWLVSVFKGRWLRESRFAVTIAWLIAAGMEIPNHIVPSLKAVDSRSITIVGDSITAGIGEEETWPRILSAEHGVNVQDISRAGATASSSLKLARGEILDSSIIIIEIGGNDILGSTSSAQFHRDLDALLEYVSSPRCQVIMFELPLPPFFHEYGRVQRVLAKKHNVYLVPKRVLLSVLASSDATLDSIHLSPAGHQLMATRVWQFVQNAFKSQKQARTTPRSR